MSLSAKGMSGSEVIRRLKAGEDLLCSRCRARLETIPRHWRPGMVFSGATCPRNQNHFFVHVDEAEPMQAVRRAMAAFRAADGPVPRRFADLPAHDPPAKQDRYVLHEPPPPWGPGKVHAIGGLVQVGYASGRDLLLVHSHQGRGLFDALTGTRIARDDEDEWGVFDPARLTVRGFDLLEGEEVRVAGLFGATLPRMTADGFALEEDAPRGPPWGPARRIVLVAPGSRALVAEEGVCELRAYGFSETGRSFVVATACDLTLFARPAATTQAART